MSILDWTKNIFHKEAARPEEKTPASAAALDEPSRDEMFYSQWRPALSRISAELETLSQGTERDFIHVGEKLSSLAARFRENTDNASRIIGVIDSGSGIDINRFKELFSEAYAEIEQSISAISAGVRNMEALVLRMNDILALRTFLKNLSHSISTLGMYIRIETARVNDSDVSTMTAVVDDLGNQIVRQTEEIASSAAAATAGLKSIIARMNETMRIFENDLQEVRQSIDDILSDMQNILEQAGNVCKRMEGRAAQINPEVGEVVSALQYHDICRQQMEHVSRALLDVAARSSDTASLCDAEKDAFNQWVHSVLSIQFHQLREIIAKGENSAREISGHLTMISDLGEAQAEDISMIVEDDSAGGNRIGKIGSEMERLSRILNDVEAANQSMISSIASLSTQVARMSEQVANIEWISDSINLLALNAIIKVARTGESGKGLGVLADEIRKLSDVARGEITKGAGCIKGILDESARMEAGISAELGRQIEITCVIGEKTGVAVKDLLAANSELLESLSGISQVTYALQVDIQALVSGITFHDVIARSLSAMSDTLRAMITDAEDLKMAAALGDDCAENNGLHELAKRYTMDSERRIHVSVTGGREVPLSVAAVDAGSSAAGAEFGDNVELF